ncbi:hypothetical protein J6590_103564 [Homalodisca vitripennis]|nr:hypothetical protein J6590_103564 [Homalodisca vitripennis]
MISCNTWRSQLVCLTSTSRPPTAESSLVVVQRDEQAETPKAKPTAAQNPEVQSKAGPPLAECLTSIYLSSTIGWIWILSCVTTECHPWRGTFPVHWGSPSVSPFPRPPCYLRF